MYSESKWSVEMRGWCAHRKETLHKLRVASKSLEDHGYTSNEIGLVGYLSLQALSGKIA